MKVHDIPDLQWDGGDLGSVVFSESFLESSINIQQKGTRLIEFSLIRMDCWVIPENIWVTHCNKYSDKLGHCKKKRTEVILKQQSTSIKKHFFLLFLALRIIFVINLPCLLFFDFVVCASFQTRLFPLLQTALCPQTAATPSWLQLCLDTPAGWYVWAHQCDRDNV